ncbi:hypothetical protein [Amycolatopsis nigrescens]|uniref:hypothetical protein n=1 Tax=Amycolatopsis nigrescens TaxID=381445 RepID=UPI000377951E|nr:hypothetical protein [Amycolatopsis nigrescens]
MRNSRQAKAMLTMLGAALALAGCGSGGSDGADDAAAPDVPAAPPSSAAPVAADGTDFTACTDGNCEVLVSAPADIPVGGHGGGITKLSVVTLDAAGLSFKTETDGGGGSGELKGGCVLTFYSGGGGSRCTSGGEPTAPEAQTGVLAMQLVSATDKGVVVRLVAGPDGPPPSSLVPRIPQIPSW